MEALFEELAKGGPVWVMLGIMVYLSWKDRREANARLDKQLAMASAQHSACEEKLERLTDAITEITKETIRNREGITEIAMHLKK